MPTTVNKEAILKLLTYADAAEILGLKHGTLYAMVSRRQIPHVRLGRRLVRFDRDELLAWVEERRVQAPQSPAPVEDESGR